MSTTGLTAQALGAEDRPEANAVLVRGLAVAALLGVGLVVALPALRPLALWLFHAEPAVELEAAGYMNARIWGAPAALMGYVVSGWLLGTGRTRALLGFQAALNGINATLDAVFVVALGWGAAGIGAGTAIAEWTALGLGLWLVRDGGRGLAPLWERARLWALFAVNRDVMIRTLALLSSYAWFVDAGTRVGSAATAANQVLLQLIYVSAFVLDAFAFIAEKEAGEAFGARDRDRLLRAMRVTSELALGFGALFTATYLLAGPAVLTLVIADPEARAAALAHLPWCALVPVLGIPAWQLDGLFLGATRGRALRTGAVWATLLYVATDLALRSAGTGNTGVWTAMVLMYLYRAGTLGVWVPSLLADLRPVTRPAG
jgi:MATE family multidrug resistance protein